MPVTCLDYGTWVIDEEGENHTCIIPNLVEKESAGSDENGQEIINRFVNLPVWVPGHVIPEGFQNPIFTRVPDWLKLDGVSEPVVPGQPHSTISAKKLAVDHIVRHERFGLGEKMWEVWRDKEKKAFMLVENSNGLKIPRVIKLADQRRLLATDFPEF